MEAKPRKKLADATADRKSYRVPHVAKRNSVSPAFVYKQIALGLLKARKAGNATIVTDQDEADWLAAMPSVKASAAGPKAAA